MEPDLSILGREVRAARQKRGLTIKGLADVSGISERFLSDLERGRGNISIVRLLEVSRALGVPLGQLVAPLDQGSERAVIALVGLRGAGKSTIGAAVARRLGTPFLELDQEIEAAAALPLAQIFEIHGDRYYRRLEREVLTRALERVDEGAVIAAGGGLVSDRQSWDLLRQSARTVWLRAKPEDHYARVMAQGDLRPMKNRPAAMAELRSLLASREPRYAEAELTIDTSHLGLEASIDRVLRFAGKDGPR
jgi:XRE family aerobic/anaerobic benzoate catabolism transcriptional regulator